MRFSGIPACAPLLLFLLITSCKGGGTTSGIANEPKPSPAAPPKTDLPAEDPYFVLTKDTVSMHGPRNITRNVLQDRHGTYWFATWEGIIRYDGKHFTNVTLQEGLRHFHVFCILEDRTGQLWFGTIGGGLYRYDGKSYTYFTTTDGLASNVILCMAEDMFGNIWFGTDKGASRYDGSAFTNLTTQDGLGSDLISTIAQDASGILWFGTDGGVKRYDFNSFTNFKNKAGTNFDNVRSIIQDKSGNIWIGSQDGLCRYDGKSLTNLTAKFTGYIFEDSAGRLWLSEGNVGQPNMTLSVYDGRSFTQMITKGQVFGITEDRDGNIWFGTEQGVFRYDGQSFTGFSG